MVDFKFGRELDQQGIYGATLELWSRLQEAGFTNPVTQVLGVAEEAGEFVGAYRRWAGQARRRGSIEEVREELADVVIVAWVASHALDIDLCDAIDGKLDRIFRRGWRDE